MLIAEYGKEGEPNWRRWEVDPAAGTVSFHNCHQSGRFLAWGADPVFVCPLSELRGVCRNTLQRVGAVIEAVTPAGRARLPMSATGYEAVRAAVEAGLRPDARLGWYQYPAAQLLIVLAAAFGVGIPATLGCSALLEQRLVSDWVVIAPALAFMSLIFIIPFVSWWKGRALW